MSFIYRSATELAESIRNGEASSTEIVEEHLERIHRQNDALDAVVILDEDQALNAAKERDKEAQAGDIRGSLHGVPMTIKEQFWWEGTKSTINNKMFSDWTAPEDAVIVQRLKSAGAVIMGKTNVPKDLLDYQVWGDLYPDGKSPYNPQRSPGGSSGGSAAALASGMTPIELGGDFGGSIRNPSHFCGLYGMKPTEGTIPNHGLIPVPDDATGHVFHMASAGPMARNIEDMDIVWKVIRGPHHSDRITPRIDWFDDSDRALSGYRVAWLDQWPGYEPSDETRSMISEFAEQLSDQGCEVDQVALPGDLHRRSLSVWMRLFGMVLAQDMPWLIKQLMRLQIRRTILKGSDEFTEEFHTGFRHSFINYSEAMGIRAELVSEWEQFFESYDVLVCPMAFGPAYERRKVGTPFTEGGESMNYVDYVWPYVACFNATRHPAMNLPLGLDQGGLPRGVQVVGPYWSEPSLIRFAELTATLTPGFVRPPQESGAQRS